MNGDNINNMTIANRIKFKCATRTFGSLITKSKRLGKKVLGTGKRVMFGEISFLSQAGIDFYLNKISRPSCSDAKAAKLLNSLKIQESAQIIPLLPEERVIKITDHLPPEKIGNFALGNAMVWIRGFLGWVKGKEPMEILEHLTTDDALTFVKILNSEKGKGALSRIKVEGFEGIKKNFAQPIVTDKHTIKIDFLTDEQVESYLQKIRNPSCSNERAANMLINLEIHQIIQILPHFSREETAQIVIHFPPEKVMGFPLGGAVNGLNHFLKRCESKTPLEILEYFATSEVLELAIICNTVGKDALKIIKGGKTIDINIVPESFEKQRTKMIQEHLIPRGIKNPEVLKVMGQIPREKFMPEDMQKLAYADRPLPIGKGQTISQPYIVAYMTQALELTGEETVLEVGMGSGYQAAILSKLCKKVFSIERIETLAQRAKKTLSELDITNVEVIIGDGSKELLKNVLFDRIIVTAAAPEIPKDLLQQLSEGGKLIMPVGPKGSQVLHIITRKGEGTEVRKGISCTFVPLIIRDVSFSLESLKKAPYQEQLSFVKENISLILEQKYLLKEEFNWLWPAIFNVLEEEYASAFRKRHEAAPDFRAFLDSLYQEYAWDYSAITSEDIFKMRNDPELRKGAFRVKQFLVEKGFPKDLAQKISELMLEYPRPLFMPHFYTYAPWSIYFDRLFLTIGGADPRSIPLPESIGWPYIYGYMIATLNPQKGDKILDIGTGTGWITTILSEMVGETGEVDSVEIRKNLFEQAHIKLLDFWKLPNVNLYHGNGIKMNPSGRSDEYYDRILISAILPDLRPLAGVLPKLKKEGRLIFPLSDPLGNIEESRFMIITRKDLEIKPESLSVQEGLGFNDF